MDLALLACKLLLLTICVNGFTIDYYECNPNQHYSALEVCQDNTRKPVPPATFALLQRQDSATTSGYSCEEIQSTFWLKCGVWAHTKIVRTPEIERKRPVSTAQCRQWITSAKYMHPGDTANLIIPGQTIVTGSDVGIIAIDHNKVTCTGQTIKLLNSVMSDTVELTQTRIVIKQVNVKRTGHVLEVLEDHILLNRPCIFSRGYCKTSERTYIWNELSNKCPLKITKVLQLTPITGTEYLVDKDEQVVLKKGSLVSSVENCPVDDLYSTEYDNLFLTPGEGRKFEEVQDIDLVTLINTKVGYSFFLSEQEALRSLSATSRQLCETKLKIGQEEELSLNNGTYITRKGDILYVNTCTVKTVTVKTGCFQDIPVEGGFVDINMRTLKKSSPPRSCKEDLIVRTNEAWINIKQQMTRVPRPQPFPAPHDQLEVFDFNAGGVYTSHEIEVWKEAREVRGFKKMIGTKLLTGLCIGQSLCEEDGAPTYTFDNLMPNIEGNLNPLSKLTNWVVEWGAYSSALVLVIESLKMIMFLIMIIWTSIMEGMTSVIALMANILCFSFVSYRKIRRNRRKNRIHEELPLSANENSGGM